jgi:hypothetical protein
MPKGAMDIGSAYFFYGMVTALKKKLFLNGIL